MYSLKWSEHAISAVRNTTQPKEQKELLTYNGCVYIKNVKYHRNLLATGSIPDTHNSLSTYIKVPCNSSNSFSLM